MNSHPSVLPWDDLSAFPRMRKYVCYHPQFRSTSSRFVLILTVETFIKYATNIASKTHKPTLIVFTPTNAIFNRVDGIVCFTRNRKFVWKNAYQDKSGEGSPKLRNDSKWIRTSFLIRGKALKSSHGRTDGWEYMTESQVLSFLGASLKPLYPNNWCDFICFH